MRDGIMQPRFLCRVAAPATERFGRGEHTDRFRLAPTVGPLRTAHDAAATIPPTNRVIPWLPRAACEYAATGTLQTVHGARRIS